MQATRALDHPLVKVLVTIVVAGCGGALFNMLGLPAAWVSGAMISVTAAVFLGVPIYFPASLRDTVFVLLGISMGSGVTPEVVERISQWPVTMALMVVVVALIMLFTHSYLHRLFKWEHEAAYFSAIPGALSYVLALASERNVDVSRVATSQSIRLLILVAALPSVITATADHDVGFVVQSVPTIWHGVFLLAVCVLASWGAAKVGVPAGWLTGAFLVSSVLNASGLMATGFPEWLMPPAYVMLGGLIGSRLSGTTFRSFVGMALISLGAVAVGLAVSASMALVASQLLDIPFGQLVLAYAPGGLEVMTLLAFMLDLDPAFVAAHQIGRYLLMVFCLPVVTLVVLGRPGKKAKGAEPEKAEND